MSDTKRELRVTEKIESVKERMCDSYCKYPSIYQDEDIDRMLDEVCANCPLDEL